MNIHDTEIVSAIRDSLIRTLGADRFALWFARFHWSPNGSAIRLEADNRFSLDLVKKNFRTEIEAAAAELGVTVEFALADPGSLVATPTVPPPSELPVAEVVEDHHDSSEPSAVDEPNGPHSQTGSDTPQIGSETPEVSDKPSAPRTTQTKMQGSQTTRRRFARIETLIVGKCNELAVTSARMVLSEPGQASPLLLHGPPGCGKTHLLEGIWARFRHQHPRQRIVYLSAEQFTTYFLEALQTKTLASFRRKYRDVDVLIVDDIQFFVGKQATIVEVVHTLDSLARLNKQVVLASDRPVGQLVELGQELCARIMGGLTCPLEALEKEVRHRLIEQGARERQLPLTPDLIGIIAEQVEGDGRQIRGVLNILLTHHHMHQTPLSAAALQRILDDLYGDRVRLVQITEIERIVCETFGLDRRALQSASRSQQLAQPRMLAMWLARRHTPAGLHEISKHFGRRSHTTVLSAEKRVENWLNQGTHMRLGTESQRISDIVRKIERRLRAG